MSESPVSSMPDVQADRNHSQTDIVERRGNLPPGSPSRLALGLAYDGRGFYGWQTQPNGNTIQDHLEQALAKIAGLPDGRLATVAAGRTDAGVHAVGQVVHVDVPVTRPIMTWVRGVNAHLPPGVAVQWAQPVPPEFDARRSALWREYRYTLYWAKAPQPLWARACWLLYPLDVANMQEAAAYLLGTHDFSAFRAAQCQANTPVRTLMRCEVRQHDSLPVMSIEFRANAFLHHMVRNMVGALVEVGLGRQDPGWLQVLLDAKNRSLAARTFPAHALTFTEVAYDPAFAIPRAPHPYQTLWPDLG